MSGCSVKISAFVITKNNSEKIGACLESLQWADEVVVVDDFSSDGTPEICRVSAMSGFIRTASKVFRNRNFMPCPWS